MESRHKILVGTVAHIARVLTLMAYNVISRYNSLQMNKLNYISTPCLFKTTEDLLSKSFDYKWIIIPDFLTTISLTMLYIGIIEFISAQIPLFMKGLLIGMMCFSISLSGTLWLAVSLPFIRTLFVAMFCSQIAMSRMYFDFPRAGNVACHH